MSINNIDLITPLFNFEDKNDFYMLYIFKRKKDQPKGEKQNSQSIRTIKTYTVTSKEYLVEKLPEIISLCEMFKARAYIHVNKLNHANISLLMLERLAQRIRNGVVNQRNLFESVVGELHSTEKRWIVDVDTKDKEYLTRIFHEVDLCDPIGEKVIEVIPTKNGFHLITKPFNVKQFTTLVESFKLDVPDIQRHNPTLLYFPDSLNDIQ